MNLFLKCHLESFYLSQSATNNRLANTATELYEKRQMCDIELEVHDDETDEIRSIKVHGALIGSRCVWFQRALNSGMIESINKYVKKKLSHDFSQIERKINLNISNKENGFA